MGERLSGVGVGGVGGGGEGVWGVRVGGLSERVGQEGGGQIEGAAVRDGGFGTPDLAIEEDLGECPGHEVGDGAAEIIWYL